MKQYLVIDSRDRNTLAHPSASDYVVKLPSVFLHVTHARLMSAEIPSTFYQFTSVRGNTSMEFRRDGVPATVTIPDATYSTLAELSAAVETALEAAYSGIGAQFTVTISPTTRRTTIVSAGATTIGIVADDQTGGTLWRSLGFELDATGFGSIVSTRPAQLTAEYYILLDIAELNDVQEAGILGVGGTPGPTFAKIPMSSAPFGTMFFDKQLCSNAISPPIQRLAELHVSFRFHDGTPVDFGSGEHAFTVELDCSQERSTW